MSDRGVYRLAAAILLQAIQDAGSHSIGKRGGALRWIGSQDDSGFSFIFICRVLDRDPVEVRRLCEAKASERRRPAAFEFQEWDDWAMIGKWPPKSLRSSAPAATPC